MLSSSASRADRDDELPPDASAGGLAPGTPVGEYILGRKLGAGAFGEVYAGEHPLIGKRVAIKVLNDRFASDPEMVARFMVEARAVNRIRQRNIIDIFAFGRIAESQRHYFVMELLEGQTLGRLLVAKGRLPMRTALSIAKDVAAALDAVHEAGITHRDLKPDNVFVTTERDGSLSVKLLDFGIAKLVGDDMAHRTDAGVVMGTPRYMSPEQARGKRADHRSDIYSLGVILHEMLTGTAPFVGDSTVDVLLKHVSDPPPAMSRVRADLPAELDAPVLAMLEKRPRDRPKTAGEAVSALEARARELGLLGRPVGSARSTATDASSPLPVSPRRVRSAGEREPSTSDDATSVLPAGWMPPSGAAPSELGVASIAGAGATLESAPTGYAARPVIHVGPFAAGPVPAMERLVLNERAMQDTEELAVVETDSAIVIPGLRRVWGIGAVGLAMAAALVVWSFERSSSSNRPNASTSEGPSLPALASSSAPAVAAVMPADDGGSAPIPRITPAGDPAADTIALRVSTRPANVELWLGDAMVGSSAAPLAVRRGGEPVAIVLKKAGFKELRLAFTPDHDKDLAATLSPLAPSPRAAGQASGGDVEKVLGGRD